MVRIFILYCGTIRRGDHRFGFSEITYYTLFKYSCNGNETSLSECMLQSTVACRENGENSQNTVQYNDIIYQYTPSLAIEVHWFLSISPHTYTYTHTHIHTYTTTTWRKMMQRTGSKLIVIIMCSILGGVLVIVAVLNTIILLCCAHKRHVESGTDLYIY